MESLMLSSTSALYHCSVSVLAALICGTTFSSLLQSTGSYNVRKHHEWFKKTLKLLFIYTIH